MRDTVLEVMLLDNNEPTSYGEAMVGPNSDKWLEAMKSEIGSIAWTLVDLPVHRRVSKSSQFVFIHGFYLGFHGF